MCAVSAVLEYGIQNPPWDYRYIPTWPNVAPPKPQEQIDREVAENMRKFLEMIEAAKRFDKAANQPHCEDPKKAVFEGEVLKRLEAIEKRLGIGNG
jgi:hypothetical protein